MEKKFKRTLVTTALPYANGPVHIGGSDEHGVPITLKAKAEGITPQDVVDRYHSIIKKSFEEFGISFDIYSRTSSDIHTKTASEFFRKLYDKGVFIEKTTEQYYDEEAKQFLADRYITGTCPHCKNERAYGDQCEACGTSLNATDLINPKSAIRYCGKRNIGICLLINMKIFCVNGFWRIIRNGNQMFTVNVNLGSIWGYSLVPLVGILIGEFPFR